MDMSDGNMWAATLENLKSLDFSDSPKYNSYSEWPFSLLKTYISNSTFP